MGLTPPDEEVRVDLETHIKNENRPVCVCVLSGDHWGNNVHLSSSVCNTHCV